VNQGGDGNDRRRDDELARIRDVYDRRSRELPPDLYSTDRPANLFLRVGQERALVEMLNRQGLAPVCGKRLLDVGCGRGAWLATFEGYGMQRGDLSGIELDPGRAGECRARLPGADVRDGSADRLPWDAGSFDMVSQFVVFSSILDSRLRAAIAGEMQRVVRPDGAIVWYDFFVDNPRNPDVRGVRGSELIRLFPGWRLSLRRCTLAPPLARRLVPFSWEAAALLESLRVFNTHYMGILRRH
jgi:SAM-dependent methyltransferase